MKRTAISLALLFVVAIVADELRASIEQYIFFRADPELAGTAALLFIRAAVCVLIFLAAGATLALRFRSSSFASAAAGAALGLLVLTPGILQGEIRPVVHTTHGPWWMNALGWVNWFGPPIASTVGAALMASLLKRKPSRTVDAG